jgi:1-acyl-sn-glycerol-3-phosphate acyltransferase
MLESLVAKLIIGFVKLLTGAQAFSRGFRPHAAQRIYYANHASHGDFVLLWATLPAYLRRKARPVAGADYWNKSALRRYIAGRVFRAVLIDRERKEDGPDPVEHMVEALANGASLILFPEGTRNTTDHVLLPFKSGLFHLANRYPRAELVPVWINNLSRVMPKGEPLPIPLLCTVTYGAPLARIDGEDKAQFLQRARNCLLDLRPPNPDDRLDDRHDERGTAESSPTTAQETP